MKTKKQQLNTFNLKKIDLSINHRIIEFMEKQGIQPKDLVKSGISTQQYISNVLNLKRIPNIIFCTQLLFEFKKLRWQWLLAGEGEMLFSKKYVTENENVFINNEEEAAIYECKNPTCKKRIAELEKDKKQLSDINDFLRELIKKETGVANSA